MYRVVRRATRFDESRCLDVVQDAMVRVIKSMKPMDQAGSLDAWLTRVARTTAYDHLRRERRRLTHEYALANGRADVISEGIKENTEQLDWLRLEMNKLDRVTAGIIDLRYRAEMTLDAIGQRLGIKTGAVHGRLNRGLKKLKQRAGEVSDE